MIVHFVGSGPGTADLLTVRATRMLATADVVLYPGTYLDPEVLDHCAPGAELVDTQGLDLDRIIEHLLSAHAEGLDTVRLTSGDPSVYSALSEQTRRLDAHGVPWDVIPGVTAYAAASALVGRELTVPLVAQSVVLTRTRSRSSAMPDTETLEAFAATRATLVLHLAIRRVRELMERIEPEYGADCPVVVAHRVGGPEEAVLHGTVGDIADAVEEAGFRQAAVILVGRALTPGTGGESFLYAPGRPRDGV